MIDFIVFLLVVIILALGLYCIGMCVYWITWGINRAFYKWRQP